MGQYYKIIFLADKKYKKEIIRTWINPMSYMNGNKLMEHSYIKNNLMNEIEYLICPRGMFYMSRIVWAGDYADPEECIGDNLYIIADSNENIYTPKNINMIIDTPTNINKIIDTPKNINKIIDTKCYRYIVNHSKNLYVDKGRKIYIDQDEIEQYNLEIHPLPILVSEGNGSGGGDYFGRNKELSGTWSRDIISMEESIPEDFEELICDFLE